MLSVSKRIRAGVWPALAAVAASSWRCCCWPWTAGGCCLKSHLDLIYGLDLCLYLDKYSGLILGLDLDMYFVLDLILNLGLESDLDSAGCPRKRRRTPRGAAS